MAEPKPAKEAADAGAVAGDRWAEVVAANEAMDAAKDTGSKALYCHALEVVIRRAEGWLPALKEFREALGE